jgi:hypothetical protein
VQVGLLQLVQSNALLCAADLQVGFDCSSWRSCAGGTPPASPITCLTAAFSSELIRINLGRMLRRDRQRLQPFHSRCCLLIGQFLCVSCLLLRLLLRLLRLDFCLCFCFCFCRSLSLGSRLEMPTQVSCKVSSPTGSPFARILRF